MNVPDRGVVAGVAVHGQAANPVDGRAHLLRIASVTVVLAFLCGWHVKTSGAVSWAACLLLSVFVGTCVVFGSWVARATSGLIDGPIGIAYELLAGFLVANTLLFFLTLASPLGMAVHVALLAVAAAALAGVKARTRRPLSYGRHAEAGSLTCIAFSGLAATFWVSEQQPIATNTGSQTVFTVWPDVFIHARVISAFAQAHGFHTLADIKLADVATPAYHFASYMMPAALNAVTGTSALDAYAAFQLPFGIMLTALGAYVMAASILRTTWPAVVASAALIALPDTYHMSGVHYLSFHFMTQVNLGMLYGLACMALAWVFMIAGCRKSRLAGVAAAYLLLATCLTYKAHLFVANALILMLYPCVFFGQSRRTAWRFVAGALMLAVFVAFVVLSQAIPRVPLLRLDGSGLDDYVRILGWSSKPGFMKDAFDWLARHRQLPSVAFSAIAATLIVSATFGFWTIAAPIILWRTRTTVGTRALAFVAIVVVNYLVMSLFLALDDRDIGAPEEFVNRPHAWAYFVVVVFAFASMVLVARKRLAALPAHRWIGPGVAIVALMGVRLQAHDIQTFPESGTLGSYSQFNSVPTCLVEAGRYVRDHGRTSDVLLDSQFDPGMVATAVAERQSYVSTGTFGGHVDQVAARVDAIKALKADGEVASVMRAWSRANHVSWYLMHPEDEAGWDAPSLAQAAFQCGGYRVFRFAG